MAHKPGFSDPGRAGKGQCGGCDGWPAKPVAQFCDLRSAPDIVARSALDPGVKRRFGIVDRQQSVDVFRRLDALELVNADGHRFGKPFDLVHNGLGAVDLSGWRQRLDPRGHVDGIAQRAQLNLFGDFKACHQDLAARKPDPDLRRDPIILDHRGRVFGEGSLQCQSRPARRQRCLFNCNRRTKDRKDTIAGKVDIIAAESLDRGDHLFQDLLHDQKSLLRSDQLCHCSGPDEVNHETGNPALLSDDARVHGASWTMRRKGLISNWK